MPSNHRQATVQEAYPDLFKKPVPTIEAESPILVAGSLLSIHAIDALMVVRGGNFPSRKRADVVLGYRILLELLRKGPRHYYDLLYQRCESVAYRFWAVSTKDSISRILAKFKSSKFGFCFVESPNGMKSAITLTDMLALYDLGVIETDLSVSDVASPIFSMGVGSSLKDVLRELFIRRIRRVFVSGTKVMVSDRRIINYIFSPEKLKELRDKPYKMLDATLGKVGAINSTEIDGDMSVQMAANAIKSATEKCMLCPRGVVTPWDLVMKPWMMERLRIRG